MIAACGIKRLLPRFRLQGRRAFTLVELLVVIAIIVLLAGFLVTGYHHVQRIAAAKETLAELHVCSELLREYENRSGLAGIEAYTLTKSRVQDPNAPAPGLFPVFLDPSPVLIAGTPGYFPTTGPSAFPDGTYWPIYTEADVQTSTSNMDTMGTARYSSKAVLCTRDVMYLLMRVPANRTTVQSIQPKRLLEPQPGQPPTAVDQGPILLDGWGNPIIFVPRGGFHVHSQDHALTYVVRSTGIVPFNNVDPQLNGSERPFWASAGEDGDFTQGGDNLYSFQD